MERIDFWPEVEMNDAPKFFYANSVDIAVSPYDFTLRFNRNEAKTAASGEVAPVIVDTSIIAMSPAHAKAMLPAIYKSIVDYEKVFGKLGLPADMQLNFDKIFENLIEK